MTAPTVGFYVHHDGRGHLERTRAVVEALGAQRSVVATSHPDASEALAPAAVTVLPSDVPGAGIDRCGDLTANGAFHWAPEDQSCAVARIRALTDWVAATRPELVVVDVSVEVAVQLRLLGVPVIVVRLPGRRDDGPHDLAHRVAEELLAPFAEAFEGDGADAAIRRRTTYCGHIGPEPPASMEQGRPVRDRDRQVLVVWGQGTAAPSAGDLDRAAKATPGWSWTMAGPGPDQGPGPHGDGRVTHLGWRDDVCQLAMVADVVVGTAGGGTIGVVAATRSRFVSIAQPRPFDEQVHAANQLERLGLAVIESAWPSPERWPAVLERACQLDPDRLAVLGADRGAARAVELIERTAARCLARSERRPGSDQNR